MPFNSLTYFVFFALTCAMYWALPTNRARLYAMLAASGFFYAFSNPGYLGLICGLSALNFIAAESIEKSKSGRPNFSTIIFYSAIALDVSFLGFFKYYNFIVQSAAEIMLSPLGLTHTPSALNIIPPLGISFYTFQLIAYLADVKKGICSPISSPAEMGVFTLFYPKISAGPITRAREFAPQLSTKRSFDSAQFLKGADLIVLGIFKKVVLADQIAPFVDKIYAAPDGLGTITLLLGVYIYAAQIYFDFSGYTDIARGCAFCFGYELPENFRHPYFSVNIAEFWRRWHITLSSWLRDYLYIPLGGNRKGSFATYRNLLITMALGGLWHGANWTFVVWGLWHGTALALSRFVHNAMNVPANKPLFQHWLYRFAAIFATFNIVSFGWIFFRAQDIKTALQVFSGIFSLRLTGLTDLSNFGVIQLATMTCVLFLLFCIELVLMKAAPLLYQKPLWNKLRPFAYFTVIVLVTLMASSAPQQFIYFQF